MTVLTQRVAGGLEAVVHVGLPEVTAVAPSVAALAGATGAPVTARWPWVADSLAPGAWAVTVNTGGEVVAAAVLTDADGVTTLAGTSDGHRGALLARDAESGRTLGEALAHALQAGPRVFALGPVPATEALGALLQHLRAEVTIEPVVIPCLVPTGDAESELDKAVRRTLRKARNRLATDGVEARVEVVTDGAAIGALLPLVLTIARDRDRSGGRVSPLDDPTARRRWRSRLLGLADAGLLQLVTMLLDDELAAYAITVLDGDVVRVLDGRYVDRFARYAPGRLLEADLLEQVRRSPQLRCLDWMTTVAPESLLGRNAAEPLVLVRGRTS